MCAVSTREKSGLARANPPSQRVRHPKVVSDILLSMSPEEMPDNRGRDLLLAEIEALLRRVDAMPTLDNRSSEEILGYDEHGLPR